MVTMGGGPNASPMVVPNITVEDPTKHLRHAAFLGMHDSVQGSSANVLSGGSVNFGTAGFSIHLDINALRNRTLM